MTDKTEPYRGPDIVIRGGWTDGYLEVDGQQLDWPILSLAWSMSGDTSRRNAVPVLRLEIECSRIRIDDRWPIQPGE